MYFEALKDLEENNRLRSLLSVQSAQRPEITVGGKKYLLFCSNNYLSLAEDERVVNAAASAAKMFGWGAGASRLLSGNHALHDQLEGALAEFKGVAAALLFGSGYQANTGAIPALVSREDLILSDELNHASIIDGCRLSGAQVRIYRHRDLQHVEELLKKEAGKFAQSWIMTESVFSMEGTLAPLDELFQLAEKYAAKIFLDDAHGFGVLGNNGEGALAHFNLRASEERCVQMATLGKAMGAFGAFIGGSKELRSYLINKARTFIFSTAFPVANAAAVMEVLNILRHEHHRLEELRRNCRLFSEGLKRLGVPVVPESQVIPIQPVMVGDEKKALRLSQHLEDSGILARAIRPPTVPQEKCRVRFSLMAGHQPHHIEEVLAVLAKSL